MVHQIMEMGAVLDNLRSSLVCAFCKSDLKDPVSARCQHSFCDPCVASACKARRPCPICNKCAKSRSLKKSSRLQSLVPLVKKLILQSQDIIHMVQDGNHEGNDLEKTVLPINNLLCTGSKDVSETCMDTKLDVKHHRSSKKRSPRLWGRLLSAPASSSSSEFDQPQKRNSVLQDEPSQQSVRAKVTDWLESSVTENEVTKKPITCTSVCDEQSDVSDDLIATSLGNAKKGVTEKHQYCVETNASMRKMDMDKPGTSQSPVFPKQKPLRTYGMTNKKSTGITYKPSSVTFSDGARSFSNTELEQSEVQEESKNEKTKDVNNVIAKSSTALTTNEDPLVPTILSETDMIKVYDSNEDLPTKKLPAIFNGRTMPVQCHLYNRMSVVDSLSNKHCGYVDIHNAGLNIVLQHLENALADLPHEVSPLQPNCVSYNSKSQNNNPIDTRDIIHQSSDEITVIADSQQGRGKRRAQMGIRTRPAKINKSTSNRNNTTSLIRNTFRKNKVSECRKHQLSQNSTRCVSEPMKERNVQPVSSERSCVSDGKLVTMHSTYSVTNPEEIPKALTGAYVSVARLDNDVNAIEKIKVIKIVPCTGTDKQRSLPKIAKKKGREVNIDLSQPQKWEQEAPGADDIICCSWNEPEKQVERSWHEECSIDSKVEAKRSIADVMEFGSVDNRECGSNGLKRDNSEGGSGFSLPKTGRNKDVTKNILDALRLVVTIDKEIISECFPISSSLIYQAIDSCQNALIVFEKEVADQDKIVQNHDFEKSTIESVNNNKSVFENGLNHYDVVAAEDSPMHDSNFSSLDLNVNAYQTVVPSSIPDDEASKIEGDMPCDDQIDGDPSSAPCDDRVVAKVASWLNRLSDLDENEGKKQKELLNSHWLRSSSNQTSCNKVVVSKSNSQVNEDESQELININASSGGTVGKMDKGGRLGSLKGITGTGQGSRSSTPLTRRSVRSHVDPDPIIEPDNQVLGLVTSNLFESDIKHVRMFASRHNAQCLKTFVPEKVTHVILTATEKRTCPRTLKYLLGIACKKWVVSMKWVTDSLKARRRLEEEDYEILDDNCENIPDSEPIYDSEPDTLHCGPNRSRLSATDFKLFESYLCICMPPFSSVTLEQLIQLLLYCGASVAQHFDEFETLKTKQHFQHRLIIVEPDKVADLPSYFLMEQQHDATAVGIEWIYETISKFEHQPLERFYLANFTQDSITE